MIWHEGECSQNAWCEKKLMQAELNYCIIGETRCHSLCFYRADLCYRLQFLPTWWSTNVGKHLLSPCGGPDWTPLKERRTWFSPRNPLGLQGIQCRPKKNIERIFVTNIYIFFFKIFCLVSNTLVNISRSLL